MTKNELELFNVPWLEIESIGSSDSFIKFTTPKSKEEWLVIKFEGEFKDPVHVWSPNRPSQNYSSIEDAIKEIFKYDFVFATQCS